MLVLHSHTEAQHAVEEGREKELLDAVAKPLWPWWCADFGQNSHHIAFVLVFLSEVDCRERQRSMDLLQVAQGTLYEGHQGSVPLSVGRAV